MSIILHVISSIFHNFKKRKPLNSWYYWCRPVSEIINTIKFVLVEGTCENVIFFSYSAASIFNFQSWIIAGWYISFICGVTYVLNNLSIAFFQYWIYHLNRMNDNLYWCISFSVYFKWKLWLYNIAWLSLNSPSVLYQLCLWPRKEAFLNDPHHMLIE